MMAAELRTAAHECLTRPFDAAGVPTLEQCVQSQVEENWYDLDINLGLLRLYQGDPSLVNPSVILQILLKALMRLPGQDFETCLYLVPGHLWGQDEPTSIDVLLELSAFLQETKFTTFWDQLSKQRAQLMLVQGFDEEIRRFVLETISLTYQRINKTTLMSLLHVDQLGLGLIVKEHGLQEEDGDILLASNPENQPKSQVFQETMGFNKLEGIVWSG